MEFGAGQEIRSRAQPLVKKKDRMVEEEVDRFEEVMEEIEERRQFLQDMAALGQHEPHRIRIMAEISQVRLG